MTSNSLSRIIRVIESSPQQNWALATLVSSEGSTYRRPGARLLISRDGATWGVLSGGCLEEELAAKGKLILAGGLPPELLSVDTRLLYGCDGKLRILVEGLPPEARDNVLVLMGGILASRRPCTLRTRFEGEGRLGSFLGGDSDRVTEQGVLIHHCTPPVRLLVFGTGPEISPMRLFAEQLGWVMQSFSEITELDSSFVPDERTAAVVMNHHFGRDVAALKAIMPLSLPYVGLLGPRKRKGEVLSHLGSLPEFDPAWLTPLHAPAGLDLGGDLPEEICLSIVAEVAAVMEGREAGFLKNRRQPIHDRQETGDIPQ